MKIFISMSMKAKGVEQVRQEMNKVFETIKANLPDANALMGCRALILKSAGTTATVVNVHRMSAAMILP